MPLLPRLLPAAARIALLTLITSLAACSFKPYRIDIQQGNVVTAEQFAQLKLGMSKEQVRFLLGTPMLTDVFHDTRWDYYYRMDRGATGEITSRSLSIYFNAAGVVSQIVADQAFRAQKAEEGNGNKVYDLSAPAKP